MQPANDTHENSTDRPAPRTVSGVGARGSAQEQHVEAERERDHSLPPPVGRLGRYDVLGRIAVGGMAEIYLGRESVETGALRHTALKLLRRQTSSEADDRYFEELFLREGRTASQLVHPNICHVYEFGKWQSDYFIAMEFIDGVALRDVLAQLERRGACMSPTLAAGIAAQVAGALEYAHTALDARRRPLGVVHLDVTPQNIMLRHDGAVKLLDFGVAQVSEPQADSRSDMIKGKTGYMAPEQVLQKPLDGRVDVFALGVCLFEMLSGARLFKRENLRATLEALFKEPIPSLSDLRPEIPRQLDDIVHRALARDRASRFQSAGELQAALEGYLATSGEVVSNRHIAALMAHLFPDAQSKAPTLYTGPEVLSRLAPISPKSEPPPQALPTPVPTQPPTRPAPRIGLWLLCAAGVLALAAGWWSIAGRTESSSGSSQETLSGSGQSAVSRQTLPNSKPTPAPEASSPPVPIPSGKDGHSLPKAATDGPSQVEARIPEAEKPSPARLPKAPSGGQTTSRSSKRRGSPGFVADPGF